MRQKVLWNFVFHIILKGFVAPSLKYRACPSDVTILLEARIDSGKIEAFLIH